MIPSQSVIRYGKEDIAFSIFYFKRKTMEVAVHPDSNVVIKAPLGTTIEEIKERLLKRARWIKKQLDFFRQFDPRTPQRKYIGGESHLYLGRQYRLKVGTGNVSNVKLYRGYFYVTIEDSSTPEKIREMLEIWYTRKAEEKLIECFERCWTYFKKLSVNTPSILLRRMKRRWGSLSSNGTLTLNTDLIRAPKECIDYVITHEMCHLIHNSHNSSFYQLLDRVMPDWEKRKHKLELVLA